MGTMSGSNSVSPLAATAQEDAAALQVHESGATARDGNAQKTVGDENVRKSPQRASEGDLKDYFVSHCSSSVHQLT